MSLPSVYSLAAGDPTITFAPASGLLGAPNMAAGVLINISAIPLSGFPDTQLWGNNDGATGWGIWISALNGLEVRIGAEAPIPFSLLAPTQWLLIIAQIGGILPDNVQVQVNSVRNSFGAVVTTDIVGAAPPVLSTLQGIQLAGAFYTEGQTLLEAATMLGLLSSSVVVTGDILVANAPPFIAGPVACGIDHVWSAAHGQRPINDTWADAGAVPTVPLLHTAGLYAPRITPGIFL